MSESGTTPERPEGQIDVGRARRLLNRSANDLDEFTVARLRAARKRAGAAAGARRHPAWWLPLSSAAIATLVMVTITANWWHSPPTQPAVASAEDMELLTAKDGPDFFDNIDFYRWVQDQRDAG